MYFVYHIIACTVLNARFMTFGALFIRVDSQKLDWYVISETENGVHYCPCHLRRLVNAQI